MIIQEIRNIKSSTKNLRNFGLLVGVVLALIGVLLLWKDSNNYPYFLYTGIALIVLGAVIPKILFPFHKAWMSLAIVSGLIVSTILLSILFYLALTPISLMMRLFGKQALNLKFDKKAVSYWRYKNKKHLNKENYERQF